MLLHIYVYSFIEGSPLLVIGHDSTWLNYLFLEGLNDKETFQYERISIAVSTDWGTLEGRVTVIQSGIQILRSFNLASYLLLQSSKDKSLFLLSYLHEKLSEFDFGVPQAYWDVAYQYCIDRNFQFCKRSKRKNASLKGRRGRSCYLYGEINIEEFRLYVIIEDSKLMTAQRFLVATPPRYYFGNFNGYKHKVNPDNTIDIWDGSYYSFDFRLEGVKLDFEG
jgi:hypothetical protein